MTNRTHSFEVTLSYCGTARVVGSKTHTYSVKHVSELGAMSAARRIAAEKMLRRCKVTTKLLDWKINKVFDGGPVTPAAPDFKIGL